MRSFWCISVIISVLFMSVDGAADSVISGHAHADAGLLQVDAGAAANLSADNDSDDDHCERCCHGHSASITVQMTVTSTRYTDCSHPLHHSAPMRNLAQAPPTPPPNA